MDIENVPKKPVAVAVGISYVEDDGIYRYFTDSTYRKVGGLDEFGNAD